MSVTIQPLEEQHFKGLHAAIDAVAKEKLFLSFTAAPPFGESVVFYNRLLKHNHISFVAVSESYVIGWCDIIPSHGQGCAHVGTLGTGLLKDYRHQGIGAELIKATLSEAHAMGLSRIQLGVRVDNLNAKALYKKLGFIEEGICRNMFLIDGTYHHSIAMALLFKD